MRTLPRFAAQRVWLLAALVTLPLMPGACSGDPEGGGQTPASAGTQPELVLRPLRNRDPWDGKRFVKALPEATGIEFANHLKRENKLPYIYSGAGIAVADYDGDGWPDIYLVCQDGPNKLYRQVDALRFEDVTASATAAGSPVGLDGGDAWGSAAAFADVDGDGDLDLYTCNTESPNLLFVNQGDGTFLEAGAELGLDMVAASTGAAFADYDNDGDLDVFVACNRVFGSKVGDPLVNDVTLPKAIRKTLAELYPGIPQFPERQGRLVVPPGYEDFYFTMEGRIFHAAQRDRLLQNDGTGHFEEVTDSAGIFDHGSGLSALWWDHDGDGWLDLYVANDLESPDLLWHNNGDGTFTEMSGEVMSQTAFFGMGSDFGDINNDGMLDFCVADMSSTSHYMSKMLMGEMDQHRWLLMNSDPPQVMRNAVHINTGLGRFLEAGRMTGLSSTDWTWAVRFADLDADGRLDFFASNGIPRFDDNPDIGMEFDRLWALGEKEKALEIARNIPPVKERNAARRNLGDLKFEDVAAEWGLDEESVGHGAVVADLDRDGDLDILVNNMEDPVSVFENRSTDANRAVVAIEMPGGNPQGIGAKVQVRTGDHWQTTLIQPTRGYMSSGPAEAHFGLGDAAAIDELLVTYPGGGQAHYTDVGANHRIVLRGPAPTGQAAVAGPGAALPRDLLSATPPLPVEHREADFDDYAQQELIPQRMSRLGPGIALGDVNADGLEEVWVGGGAGQPGSLLRYTAEGWAEMPGPWQAHGAREDLGALFFDVDGDGDRDLYVASGSNEFPVGDERYRDRLYLNGGAGAFRDAPQGSIPDLRISGGPVCGADFDRDGDVDLLIGGRQVPGRYPEGPGARLLRNDGGTLVDATAEMAPQILDAGMVSGAVFTDWNADGWQDLVLAGEWQPIRVFTNEPGPGGTRRLIEATDSLGLDRVRGRWNGLVSADLDHDGDFDLVATNLGLNTKYKASAEKPLRLYGDDVDGDGQFDVIEGQYKQGVLMPVRGRSCSSGAMPFLKEQFPTYDSFARSNLKQIYGDDTLGQALELTVTELRSGVFENTGKGFVFRPLPRSVQIAPGYGIVVTDLGPDPDGIPDLIIAQNSHSPEPETGIFGGGLGVVLIGDGNLGFTELDRRSTNQVWPGDGGALVTNGVSSEGKMGFIAGFNMAAPEGLWCDAADGVFGVRLQGPVGNPDGIGARLVLQLEGGVSVLREVHAGSGYLSQSAPVVLFPVPAADATLEVIWPDGKTTQHVAGARSNWLQVSR